MKIIAHIQNDFKTKFGLPRQSGMVEAVKGKIVFCPQYRNRDALRGLEGFSHIWLLWQFSEAVRADWSPTVRPPKLGGNKRMGVFATRSPFRPNPIGLSAVRLEKIEYTEKEGPVLHIAGCDLENGTPIYDIKPYLPYADSYPQATGGFTDDLKPKLLTVHMPPETVRDLTPTQIAALQGVLQLDPRPSYRADSQRVYGFAFSDFEVRFRVENTDLTVLQIVKK